jgi:hypothetical protein
MAKRHQGKQKPTYKSLKAKDKVMTMEGEIVDLSKKGGIKKAVGRGGGLDGLSGDKHVWGRFTKDSHKKKRPKISAKKTAKRNPPPPKTPRKARKTAESGTGFRNKSKRSQAVQKRRVPKASPRAVKKSKGYA